MGEERSTGVVTDSFLPRFPKINKKPKKNPSLQQTCENILKLFKDNESVRIERIEFILKEGDIDQALITILRDGILDPTHQGRVSHAKIKQFFEFFSTDSIKRWSDIIAILQPVLPKPGQEESLISKSFHGLADGQEIKYLEKKLVNDPEKGEFYLRLGKSYDALLTLSYRDGRDVSKLRINSELGKGVTTLEDKIKDILKKRELTKAMERKEYKSDETKNI